MNRFFRLKFSALLAGLLCAQMAIAQEVVDLAGVVPTIEQVEKGLLPEQHCERAAKDGYKCMGFKPAVKFSMPSSYFDIGSAELPLDLRKQLDVFATVMKNVPEGEARFVVTGHADASGGEYINLNLSKARAAAVKAYLADKGVSESLLVTSGKGSSALAVPSNPFSPKNRRVEIGRAD